MFEGESVIQERKAIDFSGLLAKTFMWLFIGLAITGGTALIAVNNNTIFNILFGNSTTFLILVAIELIIVLVFTRTLHKISSMMAIVGYVIYAIVNGLTLSYIFLVYTTESIALVFFMTAGVFGLLSFVGYNTQIDLSKIKNILLIGLIGIIIVSVINMFIGSSAVSFLTTIISIILFLLLTAYDIQKIRIMQENALDNSVGNLEIICALSIYLDFINLFLDILKIFGKRKSN